MAAASSSAAMMRRSRTAAPSRARAWSASRSTTGWASTASCRSRACRPISAFATCCSRSAGCADNAAAFGGDPGQRHRVRRIGRRDGDRRSHRLAAGQGPVPARDRRERPWRDGPRHPGRAAAGAASSRSCSASRPTRRAFAATSFEDCVEAVEKVSLPTTRIDLRDAEGREPVFGISRFIPVYGDDVLPEKPLDALQKGAGAEVELLIGTNAEEMNLYLVPTGVRDKLGGLLAWFVLSRSQPKARAGAQGLWPGREGQEARPGADRRDERSRLPLAGAALRRGASGPHPCLRVRLALARLRRRARRLPRHGAAVRVRHAGQRDRAARAWPATSPPQALADRVHGIWVGFATDGQLPWPEFDRDSRQVYQLEQGRGGRTSRSCPPPPSFPEDGSHVSREASARRPRRLRHRRRAGHRPAPRAEALAEAGATVITGDLQRRATSSLDVTRFGAGRREVADDDRRASTAGSTSSSTMPASRAAKRRRRMSPTSIG